MVAPRGGEREPLHGPHKPQESAQVVRGLRRQSLHQGATAACLAVALTPRLHAGHNEPRHRFLPQTGQRAQEGQVIDESPRFRFQLVARRGRRFEDAGIDAVVGAVAVHNVFVGRVEESRLGRRV